VANLAVSEQIDAGSVVAAGLVSGSTLEGNLDAAFLTGTIDPARISGDYEVTNLTVTGNANITGSTTVTPSGHVVPQANVQYDLGSAEKVWRDIYLSGSTIHLGNATIQESGGNVTISKLYIDGSITADGLLPDMTISNVQIVDESWSVLDDTAVDTSGGKIIVHGSGFGPGSLCQIGGTNATSTSYVSPTQLRVETGARTSGTKSLTIVRGDTQTATFPSGVTFSDTVTWVTGTTLPDTYFANGFSTILVASSDSNILYSNLTALPTQTTLNPETGVLSGNITSLSNDTLFSVDASATDEELQNAERTFLMSYKALNVSNVAVTDNAWTVQPDLAVDTAGGYVQLGGGYFLEGDTVTVDNVATATTYVSPSVLRAVVPAKSSGTYSTTVMRNNLIGGSANLTYSVSPSWITTSDLGNVFEMTPFNISLQGTSDSTITYSNVNTLPPNTTLNTTTGVLSGNITATSDQVYTISAKITDLELQSAIRTFSLSYKLAPYVVHTSSGSQMYAVTRFNQTIIWGLGTYGQIGDGGSVNRSTPVSIANSGSLSGKTVVELSFSFDHTVCRCSDNSVHAWGRGEYYGLGNGSTSNSSIPINISNNGSLSGRNVVQIITVSNWWTYALCDDNTLHAWGGSGGGLPGDGTSTLYTVPTLISSLGSMTGKTITRLYSGWNNFIALCSDGTLHSWGAGNEDQIGDGSVNTVRYSPVDITNSGSLSGKTAVTVGMGAYVAGVICSDNSIHTWGENQHGILGKGDDVGNSPIPVNITNNGSLNGRTPIKLQFGSNHAVALCSDGTCHSWGYNAGYAVGDGSQTNRFVPVNTSLYGSLAGKFVTDIHVGRGSTVAKCSDNTFHQWGSDYFANGTTSSSVPTNVTSFITPFF
jgi:alpha-tubulin suppressor-like RCC1 family protein